MYQINLSSVPNFDFNERNTPADPATASASTFDECSKICRQYITDNDLGSGNWNGGQIIDENGNQVARVSYNGRIWES